MDVELKPWEIRERTKHLSDRGRLLAANARNRMEGVPLRIEVGPCVGDSGGAELNRYNGRPWVDVAVYCERVPSDGSGDVDYILAHELGHAIRMATGAEPPELRQMYDEISANPDFRPTDSGDFDAKKEAKEAFMQDRPDDVKRMIVDDEREAWAIARELFEGIEHEKERLDELERNAGYSEGLFPDPDDSP